VRRSGTTIRGRTVISFVTSDDPSADEYREYAEQCMALASKSPNPGDKARLLQMAQAWHDLAEKPEASQNKSAGKDSA
jgi:hypothetical protein